MMAPLLYLCFLLTTLLSVSHAAFTDPVCVQACSDWSIVLGHCRGIYGNEPWMHNETFANDFLHCCCAGEENDKILGEEASLRSAGICQSCNSTPPTVKKDLTMLLDLCTIQSVNGTAGNATLFKPQGYATSQDRTKAGTSLDSAGREAMAISIGSLICAATLGLMMCRL